MKTFIFRITILIAIFCSLSCTLFAQEQIRGTKQKLDIKLDELGNAEIALTMKLNASQWDLFKRTMGNNTANLKREFEKGMPTVYLTDFSYDEDQMERTYTLKMKAYGVATLDKNGKWRADLDAKDPDIMKVNDQQFKLDVNYVSSGGLIEQSQLIYLPENAENGKVEKDSFGKAVLIYQMGSGLFHMFMTITGILLILGGGVLFYFNKMKFSK